ncbi:MAG: cyclase family protein [Oscillospiraceae bacterium]|nr:cyclase family protein [Oscillospiraceae bacterium]
MKIYDITQELTTCTVYPGDKTPEKEQVYSIEKGDLYNLTNISLCTHNGTHVDAPCHFIKNGNSIENIPLEKFIGPCCVVHHDGDFNAQHATDLLANVNGDVTKRILIKGNVTVMADAAKVFADKGIYLIGNESQTIGPKNAPMEVHKILLSENVVLLEGIKLHHVLPGEYFLSARPINIAGSDGSPCRAVLIEF